MKANQQTIEKILKHFERLSVSVDNDPYSGLMAEPDDDGVRIYDAYASGIYCPVHLLKILEGCQSATLESPSTENIWQIISPAIF